MTSGEQAADDPVADLARVRELVAHATQRLLGDTIGLGDSEWSEPSLLPGWTRGHVGTHVARSGDGVGRLATWALTGRRQPMYASDEARTAEIEEGARRGGLEIQVDLDTSAGRLTDTFARLDDPGPQDQTGPWDREVEMRGGRIVPARVLPLVRLLEVCLHHVDLGIGFAVDDIGDETAGWLLRWSARRVGGRDDWPAIRLRPDGADPIDLGTGSDASTVSGPAVALLGWLTSRGDAERLTGADAVTVPSFG